MFYCPAAGVFVQSTDGSRGRPSQRSAFSQRSLSVRQSERVKSPRHVREEERNGSVVAEADV